MQVICHDMGDKEKLRSHFYDNTVQCNYHAKLKEETYQAHIVSFTLKVSLNVVIYSL